MSNKLIKKDQKEPEKKRKNKKSISTFVALGLATLMISTTIFSAIASSGIFMPSYHNHEQEPDVYYNEATASNATASMATISNATLSDALINEEGHDHAGN